MTERLAPLFEVLGRYSGLVTAYSGGADSALLAWAAHEVHGLRALAVTAVSASLPAAERADARAFARTYGLPQVEVCTDELDRPGYRANRGDRCWHCKSALMDAVLPIADAIGVPVALGTNLDDLTDHRPGQAAALGRGAVTPLVEAGMTKADVRAASRAAALVTAAKPAAACLASRVAYHDPVDARALERVELAERALHELGFGVVRVRAHGNGAVARVEVPVDRLGAALEMRVAIVAACRSAGFGFAALDLDGFASGSMNRLLETRRAAR